MMDPEDKALLDQLQAQVQCPRNFACLFLAVEDLCDGTYNAERDVVECRNCRSGCPFCIPASSIKICACPLRMFIAKNFDRWSAASTAQLRLRMQHPLPPRS